MCNAWMRKKYLLDYINVLNSLHTVVLPENKVLVPIAQRWGTNE